MVKHFFNINSYIYVIHVIAQISSTWLKRRAHTSLNHLAPRLPLLSMQKLDITYYILHISQSSRPVHSPLLNMHVTMLVSSHAKCHLSICFCYLLNLFERKQITVLITHNISLFKVLFYKDYSTEKTINVLITNATVRAQLQHVTFQNTHF